MSETQQQVFEAVKEYVTNELMQGDAKGLDGQTPLLELGIVDSLRIAGLVTFLEGRFEVQIRENEMVPANFSTLDGITALVVQRMRKSA